MPLHDLTTMMEDDTSSAGGERGVAASNNSNDGADTSTKLPSSEAAGVGVGGSSTGGGTSEKQQQNETMSLGGSASIPCYALLDGVFQEPDGKTQTRVTIPITRLPAILGRTHDTDDPHFFGLGKKKALSRKQCLIEYRVPSTTTTADGESKTTHDGRVEWDEAKQKLIYKDKKDKKSSAATSNQGEVSSDSSGGDIENTDPSDLPSTGYFAIGSLGKNRIMVNQERISQGKVAVLKSGTPIRISSYMLYFLLPTDVKPETHVLPLDEAQSSATSNKKRKAPPADNEADSSNNKKSKATAGGGGGGIQPELDALSVEELLDRFSNAIQGNEEWERKHQLVGSTIALHAVRSAALDPDIQAEAVKVNTDPNSKDKNSGVSRTAIMDWIENSPKYGEWVQQMLTKIEPESYKASITKSLLKAGFTRTGTSGRYVKWLLPKDIMSTIKVKKSKPAPAAAKTTAKAKAKTVASNNEAKEEDGGGGEKSDDDSAAPSAGPKNDGQEGDDEDDDEDEEHANEGGEMNNDEEGDDDDEADSDNNEEEEDDDDGDDDGGNDEENGNNEDDDESSSSEMERAPGNSAAAE